MATYPLPTLACTIDRAGISAPSYEDILASLKASFRLIYGDDAYLEADSQDGQFVAIIAKALDDANQATISVYNSFSPQTAVGAGLSNVVKINHMRRLVATKSQVNLTLTGVGGTSIISGRVRDVDGNVWLLPAVVTIPSSGSIIVTAEAEQAGSINAPTGSCTVIATPTAGWQEVTNASAATPGQPIETDAQLRARQEITPAINAYTVLTGLAAAIKAIPGVTYGVVYENDTGTTSGDGIPAHSIAAVVKGGDANLIAQAIFDRKAPGVGTHGTTTINITDISGALRPIKFFIPTERVVQVEVSLYAENGYNTEIANQIKQSVAAYINGLDVGENVILTRLYAPALLNSVQNSETYRLSLVRTRFTGGSFGTADLAVAFNEKATSAVAEVSITVL